MEGTTPALWPGNTRPEHLAEEVVMGNGMVSIRLLAPISLAAAERVHRNSTVESGMKRHGLDRHMKGLSVTIAVVPMKRLALSALVILATIWFAVSHRGR